MRTAVLTVSTTVARREREDASGPALARLADEAGCDVVAIEVVGDDGGLIVDRLRAYVNTPPWAGDTTYQTPNYRLYPPTNLAANYVIEPRPH